MHVHVISISTQITLLLYTKVLFDCTNVYMLQSFIALFFQIHLPAGRLRSFHIVLFLEQGTNRGWFQLWRPVNITENRFKLVWQEKYDTKSDITDITNIIIRPLFIQISYAD